MPLIFTTGNLLESNADILVSPVNCVGVSGAGLAKQFATKFKEWYTLTYIDYCKLNLLKPGVLLFSTTLLKDNTEITFLYFPTKIHFKDPSKLEWIISGLKDLRKGLLNNDILRNNSIAMPKLGCGLGRLKWEEVKPWYIEILADLPNNIYVYE